MIRTAHWVAAIGLLAACNDGPTASDTASGFELQPAAETAAEHRGLAALRAATARFHRFELTGSAGYDFLFMDMCMEDRSPAARGGMGYHYVNLGLLDGTVNITAPEALMYEPGPNGQLRLVGVEYVIPEAAWTSEDPPTLLGQEFTLNDFGLWALHVWVWKRNPSGIYADWNPNVNCDNADQVSTAAHH